MSQVKKMKTLRDERVRRLVTKPRRSMQMQSEIKALSVADIARQHDADPNDRSLVDCPNTWWP